MHKKTVYLNWTVQPVVSGYIYFRLHDRLILMFMKKNVHWCDAYALARSAILFSREIDKTRLCCMQPDRGVHSRNMKMRYYEGHCTHLVECVAQVATIHNTHMCTQWAICSFIFANANNTYATISINIFVCGPIIFIDKVSVRRPAICSSRLFFIISSLLLLGFSSECVE